MTTEEIDNMKYKVCCALCDNYKCVKGTDKCEAEKWARDMKGAIMNAKKCDRCGKYYDRL